MQRYVHPGLRLMRSGGFVLLASLVAGNMVVPAQAVSDPAVSYRLADHGASGRLVVMVPNGVVCTISRDDDDEVVKFDRPVRLQGSASASVTGVVSASLASTALSIRLKPRTATRLTKIGSQLILDLSVTEPRPAASARASEPDPSPVKTSGVSVLPGLPSPMVAVVERSEDNTARPTGGSHPAVVGHVSSPAAVPADDLPPKRSAVDADAGPVSVAASVISSVSKQSDGLMLPFDRRVGAAAFRRNNLLTVVFDTSQPVDLASVAGDPVFGRASFALLPSGAVLTMPIEPDQQAAVLRQPEGWVISMAAVAHPATSIDVHATAGVLMLSVAEPGHVVVVPDPRLGTDLLVGTTRQDGQAMPLSQRGSDYALKQTVLGVVVERLSDQLELHATSMGFSLGSPHVDESMQPGSTTDRPNFSRNLDLPAVTVAELQRRYKVALAAAAALPAADRRVARLDAAEIALALGLGREAGQLASIADQDAPTGPDGARSAFLRAAAAVLDHDPAAADRLADPRIGNTDELALWRGLELGQRHPEAAEAARLVAQRLSLLQAYPGPLRRQLLGAAALSLVSGGDQAQAALVGRLDGDGQVKLARALLQERDDHASQALDSLTRLAADPDPSVIERASEEAIDLQLKLGQIGPKQAADRLEKQILNARMAGDELPLRLRIVALRVRQKDWAGALSGLREISSLFPEGMGQVHQAATTILEKIAAPEVPDPDTVSPAGAVAQLTLIQDNLDLLPAGVGDAQVSIDLARRLTELDLPDRAAALIRKAIAQARSGPDRARLGLALGRLCLDQNDSAGAGAALGTTDVPGLPPDLLGDRALLQAHVLAAAGDHDGALRSLAPLRGVEAEELRAKEFAAKQDWVGEEAALGTLVTLELPASGPLDKTGEGLILRLVQAAVHVGDQDALHRLAATWTTRFRTVGNLNMLHLLTASSVATVGDLPRSAAELAATRTALSALATASDKH